MSCASPKFVCDKPLKFGFMMYLIGQRGSCSSLIVTYPTLQGARTSSTLYTLLGQAGLAPDELSKNKKTSYNNLIFCVVFPYTLSHLGKIMVYKRKIVRAGRFKFFL